MAICAAGPPQARAPNLRKRRKIEPGESAVAAGCGAWLAVAGTARRSLTYGPRRCAGQVMLCNTDGGLGSECADVVSDGAVDARRRRAGADPFGGRLLRAGLERV